MLNTILQNLKINKPTLRKSDPIVENCTVINFLTLKGGVGKTTLALELCKYLIKKNQRVLAVDLDPQANLTLALTELSFDQIENLKCFYDLIYHHASFKKIVIKTKHAVDLLPSTSVNSLINQSRDRNLIPESRRLITELKKQYDYIIFDSNPTASVSHAIGVLNSDIILSPILIDAFSVQGVLKTIGDVEDMCRQFDHSVKHRVLFNKINNEVLIAERAQQIRDILPKNSWLTSFSVWNLDQENISMQNEQINKEFNNLYDFLSQEKNHEKRLHL